LRQVDGEYYQALFGRMSSAHKAVPVAVSADSRSANEWDLAQPHRGGVKAAGVGGGITGLGANLFVLDDPFKNREEAESENQRELVDGWWKSSARTRLQPNGAIIVFHTRWHPDDQAGKLIQKMVSEPEADQYEIVSLPALALDEYPADEVEQRKKMRDGVYMPLADPLGRAAGEALWPTHYSKDYLLSTRADMGLYDFEALYQQSPFLMEGNMFKRDWFTVVDKGPEAAYARVRAWDKAATSGGGARSASVLMSWGLDDYVYIEHVSAEQMSSAERDERMVALGLEDYSNYGPFVILHPQDPGSAGLDSARASNDLLANSGLIGDFQPVTGDKVTNAGPLATKAKGGRVRLVRGAWNDRFLDEGASFPKGRFKDQIDAGSTAYNYLREAVEKLKAEEAYGDTLVYEERVNISPV
ncbi:MAG: terminase family protein, partial [Chloroflexi bacterium]|nr:terminase family protein [Chloroflexota bacterium]